MSKNRLYCVDVFLVFLIISMPFCFASEIESYTYDANGNLVSGDGYYREYNGFNQLVEMRNGSNASALLVEQYIYDADGQRMLTIQNNSGSITKIYTPTREMMRIVNSSGTFDYRYVYVGDKLVARLNPDGSKYFYHGDSQRSTDLISDDSGLEVETTKYEVYGEIESGGAQEKKLYTGQFDDNTNQYYYGARYYKPETGQFISPDPLYASFQYFAVNSNLLLLNPQRLNKYAYALNGPYRYIDINGLVDWPNLVLSITETGGGGLMVVGGYQVGIGTSPTIVGVGVGTAMVAYGSTQTGVGLRNVGHSWREEDLESGPLGQLGSLKGKVGQTIGNIGDTVISVGFLLKGGSNLINPHSQYNAVDAISTAFDYVSSVTGIKSLYGLSSSRSTNNFRVGAGASIKSQTIGNTPVKMSSAFASKLSRARQGKR